MTDAEQTGTSAQRLATIQAAADDVVTRVNELTDRTSPEDFPEALLITSSELHRELMRFAEDIGALRTAGSQDARPGADAVALVDTLPDLVSRFSNALLAKLRLAQANGRFGWERDDWEKDCQEGLLKHLAKGDPRDVAAYCAFMWHHGWITQPTTLAVPQSAPAVTAPHNSAERLPNGDTAVAGADAVALADIRSELSDLYCRAKPDCNCTKDQCDAAEGECWEFADRIIAALAAPEPQAERVLRHHANETLEESEYLLAQPQGGGASEPVAWCGWHPDHGYNLATKADTEQGAVSRLMRTGIAGTHGWIVRRLVYVTPSSTAAERESTAGSEPPSK